jgi:hypothetical protein
VTAERRVGLSARVQPLVTPGKLRSTQPSHVKVLIEKITLSNCVSLCQLLVTNVNMGGGSD